MEAKKKRTPLVKFKFVETIKHLRLNLGLVYSIKNKENMEKRNIQNFTTYALKTNFKCTEKSLHRQ